MSEMKIRVEKRTSVFSGYRWISIKSWQQVEPRQTESESSSGQMEEKHKNGQKSQGIKRLRIISFCYYKHSGSKMYFTLQNY